MHFRAAKNAQELPARLLDNGELTPDTWECIKYRVGNLKNALADLGFDGVEDPIRQHTRFTEFVKQFQNSAGILPDGLLSQKTIQTLINTWKSSIQSDSSISV